MSNEPSANQASADTAVSSPSTKNQSTTDAGLETHPEHGKPDEIQED